MGRVRKRLALDGFAVVQDYEQERNGSVNYRGHGIFIYDAAQECYVLHWLDSLGMPPNEFRGGFEGDVLTLTGQMPQSTRARAERSVRQLCSREPPALVRAARGDFSRSTGPWLRQL